MSNTDGAAMTAKNPANLQPSQILEVTRRCLRDFGYEATTIRRIAGMLGCAVGSIYRYFRDKRELLSAVAGQQLAPATDIGQMSFEQSVRKYIELTTEDPGLYWLMFWLSQSSKDDGKLPPVIDRVISGWAEGFGDRQLAQSAWALLHGCLTLGYDADQTITLMNHMVSSQSTAAPAPSPTPRHTSGTPLMPETQPQPQAQARRIRRAPAPPTPPAAPELEPELEAELELDVVEEEYEDVCLL